MTQNSNTFRLLVVNDALSEAERLISMLHNSGRPVRAQHVESPEALSKLLQEKTWDIMIADEAAKNVPPSEAIKLIKRLNKDVPVIIQTDRQGAHAVARRNENRRQ